MDPTNALHAHSSQALGADAYTPAEPGASPPPSPGAPSSPGVRPVPGARPAPEVPAAAQPPMPPSSPPPPATAATHSMVATSAEQCPSCGVHVAPDQRYCLACGARCGEPRLPIMDAVAFMDAMKQPRDASAAPPQRPPRRVSPNMALFATIGVLLLAMGVGVLIGRSGNHSVASAPQAAPIVIKGNGTEENTATSSAGSNGSGVIGGGSKKAKPKELKAEADSGKGAEEVLHTAPGVKLAEPKVGIGDKCSEDTAGCKNGKFEGSFFE